MKTDKAKQKLRKLKATVQSQKAQIKALIVAVNQMAKWSHFPTKNCIKCKRPFPRFAGRAVKCLSCRFIRKNPKLTESKYKVKSHVRRLRMIR